MRRPLLATVALIATVMLSGHEGVSTLRAATSTVTYPPGWNLVGGPAGTKLSGASATLYTLQFKDGSYQAVTAPNGLTGGLGYWAYFLNGGSATLTDGGPCVVAVPIGGGEWVMVGDPWPNAAASVRSVERSLTWEPASGYSASFRVQPGHGAWAYSSVATTVALVVDGCSNASSVPPSAPVPPPGS